MGDDRETRIEYFAPTKPDRRLIELLHRSHDAFVMFARKHGAAWTQGASVRAADLKRWMPKLAPHLERNSYFSVNGFFRGERWPSKWIPELPSGVRTKRLLQWLTACFVDLDIYTLQVDPGTAIEGLRQLEVDGTIPRVSIWLHSGRGLWTFWLLRARDGDGPIRSRDSLLPLVNQVQRALAARLHEFGADLNAIDVARVTRVPGSLNSKSGTRVTYDVAIDAQTRKPITYGLDDLARFVGIDPDAKASPRRRSASSPHVLNGKNGPKAKAIWSQVRFDALRSYRRRQGGFPIGTRYNSAVLFATWLLFAGFPKPLIRKKLEDFFAHDCVQATPDGKPDPIGPDEARSIAASPLVDKNNRLQITHQRIADMLKITTTEAHILARMEGRRSWPPATGQEKFDESFGSMRKFEASMRRDLIRTTIEQETEPPTLRELQSVLAEWDLRATLNTIKSDLVKLGIASPRTRLRLPGSTNG